MPIPASACPIASPRVADRAFDRGERDGYDEGRNDAVAGKDRECAGNV